MTTTLTLEQKIATLRHLAGGKGLDVVATIVHQPREVVLDLASRHGYPDREKLAWAADILTTKREQDEAPTEHPQAAAVARRQSITERAAEKLDARPVPPPTPRPAVTSTPPPAGGAQPDEIRALVDTAKAHDSKRIQAAGDRVLQAVDRLRDLLREDQERNAEKRRKAAEREAARAEVKRLEAQLRAARAKLKSGDQRPGGEAAVSSGQIEVARANASAALLCDADLEPLGLTSRTLRAWARDNDVDCPVAGRIHRRVLDAWQAAQPTDERNAS